MSFLYLRDPVFLMCFLAYWINRGMEWYDLSPTFFQKYLNDLICIPFWVPTMLWAARKLTLRSHNGPPNTVEIFVPLFFWSLMFEVVFPAFAMWRPYTSPDPNDVCCYSVGAVAAMVIWNRIYRRTTEREDALLNQGTFDP